MVSRRNVQEEILDAARTCLEAYGVRRTTLSDIARQAGLSRPTVYRHWPDITSLIADLLTREMRRILAAAAPASDERTAREILLGETVSVIGALREDPLFSRIIATEPDVLTTYAFQRLGASQLSALDLIEARIRAGQDDNSIRDGDPAALARMVLLVTQSAVTSWRLVDDALPGDRLTAEISLLLDAYLHPRAPRPPDQRPEPVRRNSQRGAHRSPRKEPAKPVNPAQPEAGHAQDAAGHAHAPTRARPRARSKAETTEETQR